VKIYFPDTRTHWALNEWLRFWTHSTSFTYPDWFQVYSETIGNDCVESLYSDYYIFKICHAIAFMVYDFSSKKSNNYWKTM